MSTSLDFDPPSMCSGDSLDLLPCEPSTPCEPSMSTPSLTFSMGSCQSTPIEDVDTEPVEIEPLKIEPVVMRPCPSCPKVFERLCDLRRHEKTHNRPWKCREPSCRYHIYGWPTEKQLDRHMDVKHSPSPILYKCELAPCTYQSRRESNCKQHMEKSHGRAYIRKRNYSNGPVSVGSSQLTPQSANVQEQESGIYETNASRTSSRLAPHETHIRNIPTSLPAVASTLLLLQRVICARRRTLDRSTSSLLCAVPAAVSRQPPRSPPETQSVRGIDLQ
jgi:hypothetical protein